MKLKSRKKDILFIFIILIIQTTIFIIAGINKSYIHMDEAYSLGMKLEIISQFMKIKKMMYTHHYIIYY